MQAPVQTHEKVCDENESTIIRKKQCKHKNVFDGRRAFIRYTQKTHAMDIRAVR